MAPRESRGRCLSEGRRWTSLVTRDAQRRHVVQLDVSSGSRPGVAAPLEDLGFKTCLSLARSSPLLSSMIRMACWQLDKLADRARDIGASEEVDISYAGNV